MSMNLIEPVKVEPVEYIPPRVLKGTLPDGREVLVTLWDAESGEVAFREPGGTWGPAVEVIKP